MNTEIDVPLPDAGAGTTPDGQTAETEDQDLAWYKRQIEDKDRRIGKLTAREKSALEERDRIRQHLESELAEERRRSQQATQVGATFAEKSLETQAAQLKEQLKRAFESGESDTVVTATEALAEVKAQQLALKGQARPQQEQPRPEQRQQPQAPQIPPAIRAKAAEWIDDNSWFNDDPAKKAEAERIDHTIMNEGYAFGSPAYFKELTARTRHLAGEEAPQARPSNAGSGVTRTVVPGQGAPRSVRLTADQLQAAADLNMTPEAYGKRLVKLTAEGKFDRRR